MQVLFVICLIFLLGYVCLKKRKFDFFTIAAFSAFIYYYPCIIGYLSSSDSNAITVIPWRVYGCITIFLIVLTVFIIVTDKYVIKFGGVQLHDPNDLGRDISRVDNYSINLAVLLVEILGLFMVARVYISYGGFGMNFNKMQLLAEANRFTEYMKYIALFTFVHSYINAGPFNKCRKIFSTILIGYTFLLGHRSFLVIGIIAIFMHYVGTRKKIRLLKIVRKNWILFLGMIIAAFFVLFVKNVFAAFMSGQYDLVISRLTDPEYYIRSLLNSEANSITYNLFQVIYHDVKYSFGQFLIGFFQLIPVVGGYIANSLGYSGFEFELNQRFNTQLDQGIGLGSTYLGEAYAIGGYTYVTIAMILTFCFLLFLLYKRGNTSSSLAYTFYGIVATYFTFYIHRNSLIFLLVTARAYIYIWFIIWIVSVAIRSVSKR